MYSAGYIRHPLNTSHWPATVAVTIRELDITHLTSAEEKVLDTRKVQRNPPKILHGARKMRETLNVYGVH
ncbi:hypothetical protein WH47_07606 [Habropoda laboriosa]|uniref:Uncharacterized protein n=1 Tax=Habropoda laboriosa TaxID=597456 RepID=A0A0L7REA4_9HYME|nr:hypothetical protein WH47_07606 [Habropoda laboriosa]